MLLSKNEKSAVIMSRKLSRWFQVKIEIRMFGKLIWSYVWPPDSVSINSKFEDDENEMQ